MAHTVYVAIDEGYGVKVFASIRSLWLWLDHMEGERQGTYFGKSGGDRSGFTESNLRKFLKFGDFGLYVNNDQDWLYKITKDNPQ